MVQITINGRTVDAEPGRRLVEVIKDQGIAITNLCYIDGLEPYAGCRTCIVEIEGGRPTNLQLSCVAQVAEGMVCFGASVLDSRNMPIAGVAVSLLAEQTTEEDRKQIIANVKRITSRLSQRMGADIA